MVHKVAAMENTPKFVPKFSFNPFKMNVWVIKHNLAAGVQSKLRFYSYFVFNFLLGYRQFCKMFAHFYQFITCIYNEIVCKALALTGTFK